MPIIGPVTDAGYWVFTPSEGLQHVGGGNRASTRDENVLLGGILFTNGGAVSFNNSKTLSFRRSSSAWLNLRELAHVGGGGEARPALGSDRVTLEEARSHYTAALSHALGQIAFVDPGTRDRLFGSLLGFITSFESIEGLFPLLLTGINNAAVAGSYELAKAGVDTWRKYSGTIDEPIDMTGYPFFDCLTDTITFVRPKDLDHLADEVGSIGADTAFVIAGVVSSVNSRGRRN